MKRRKSGVFAFLLTLFLVAFGSAALALPTVSFDISYSAPGVVHATYSFSQLPTDNYQGVRIRALTGPGGGTQDWANSIVVANLPGTAATDVPVHLSGWNAQDNFVYLRIEAYAGSNEYTVGFRQFGQGSASGTLLYDESVSGALGSLSVTVPEGIHYAVGDVQGPVGSTSQLGTIQVHGSVETSSVGPLRIGFILHTPHDLRLPDFANASFQPGSEGSSLSGSDSNSVAIFVDGVTLSSMTNLKVSGTSPFKGGGFTVRDCSFIDNGFPRTIELPAGKKVTLRACDFSALTTTGFTFSGGADVRIENCTGMPSVGINSTPASSVNIIGCDFQKRTGSSPYLCGIQVNGPVNGSIQGCDVGGIALDPNWDTGEHPRLDVRNCTVRGDISMRRPLPISISGNLLTGSVNLGDIGTTTDQTRINGNSFVGMNAITSTTFLSAGTQGIPMPLGSNYYGDRQGPKFSVVNQRGSSFLDSRGAEITNAGFVPDTGDLIPLYEIAAPSTRGQQYTDTRFFPEIWIAEMLGGQISIQHDGQIHWGLNRDLPTLVSYDIACSHDSVSGVQFYLEVYNKFSGFEWDPTLLLPVSQPDVLHRDSAPYGNTGTVNGERTVNFIVPPEMATMDTVGFKLYADMSGVTGYDGDNPGLIQIGGYPSLGFGPVRTKKRPLRIEVIPIKIDMPDFPTSTPDGAGFANRIERAILATLPLTEDQLEITVSPPYQFTWGSAWFLAKTRFMNELAGRLALLDWYEDASADNPAPDLRVAVVAPTALGPNTYGASMALRRSILMVDERTPETTLHEWGHYLGLNNIIEQYTSTPPDGIEIEGMTMFPANGDTSYLGGDKFLHMPYPNHYAIAGRTVYTDLMGTGASGGRFWPTYATLGTFRSYIHGIIYNNKSDESTSTQHEEEAEEKAAPVPTGKRRIQVSGRTLREDDGSGGERYRFEQGSLRAVDITRLAKNILAPNTAGPGDACTITATGDPSDPNWSAPFFIASSDGLSRESDIWAATFDVPENTTRLTITRNAEPGVSYLDIVTADDITATLLKPAQDESVGADMEIAWSATSSSTGQPLQVAVYLSRGNGRLYLLDILENRTSWTIPTTQLQPGDLAAVALLVSDGLRSQIVNASLVVTNRAPRATIAWPPPGTRIAPGALIDLVGNASDFDGGDTITLAWTSDLDGELGTTEALKSVALTEGFHRLTFAATDSEGQTATADTTVSVRAFNEMDLRIEPNALTLAGPFTDPTGATAQRLLLNEPHAARVTFRNGGAPTTATLSLALLTPTAQTHQVLFEQEFVLDALEPVEFAAGFTPVEPGNYLIGAWVSSDTYPDPNEANNLRLWTYSTESDPPRAIANKRTLVFGAPASALTVEVWNAGEAALVLGGVSIAGANSQAFALQSVPAPGTVIPAGESRAVTVLFAPRSAGAKTATLSIETNDPTNLELPVTLTGTAANNNGAPEGWGVK